jgi:HK97 family phage portal protein
MGLLSLQRESRAGLTAPLSPKDPALADMFSLNNVASGQIVTSDTAMRVSAVYACVTVLSQTLAMLPKYIKQVRPDGGLDIFPNHRLYKQIHNRPNRWQSSFEYFEMMEGHRLLRGNAYARIITNPGRGINELVPMHPDRVWPFIITPNGVTYYMYDNSPCPPPGSKLYYQYFPINGDTEVLLAEEVHVIRGYSTNGIVGLNPITKVAREAIGLAMATEETGARLFSNGAQISKVFTHPAKMSDAVYDRMKKQLNTEFAGAHNANKTMILEEGMDITSLSMTMNDAQFLETRKFQIEDIARIFNVPLILIGAGDKAATFASAEQFFMSFKVHTLQPNVTRWEAAMERDLLYPSEMNQIKIDMDIDSMMRGDAQTRSTYLRTRFNMASMTPNQIRLYENENPQDGDESDLLYIQGAMIPLSMAGKITKGQPTQAGVNP